MSDDDIQGRIDRLEEIAEQLEEGAVDLATANDLREEADEHLAWLRAELELEDGSLVELPDRE
jgi:exonuclease VII small subunit